MKKLLSILILALSFMQTASAFEMQDLVERKEIQTKIEKELLKLDVKFDVDIGSIDLIDGINVSSRYRYEVEPSYQDKYFTRIDKWDLNTGINAGTLIKDLVDLPFGFNISRNNSFIFVRQFKEKSKALNALPYDPHKMPITANRALKLAVGDFVSIPANLNLGFTASVGNSVVTPVTIVNAGASAFFVVSGEFTIQVFRLDETHVRLKLISNRAFNGGTNGHLNADINFSGFRIFADKPNDGEENNGFGAQVSKQLDRQMQRQTLRLIDRIIDREFLSFGINYTPGASYIADYVFDLSDEDAKLAYNQILSSAYKLKDILVIDNFLSGKSLKDKLITTTEMADKLSERDSKLPVEERKVSRIFKGFNNYKALNRNIKLGALIASYKSNTSTVENKITFTDKNNHSLEFFYPTFSQYFETNFGRWLFNLKDQANKTYFGLIPRKDEENVDFKNPDFGLTFERRDKVFTHGEQKRVADFMLNQLPLSIVNNIDFKEWRNGERKIDSRIYFQVILKSQGFNYLRKYSQIEFATKLVEYLKAKKLIHVIRETSDDATTNNDNDTFSDRPSQMTPNSDLIELGQIKFIASTLYNALNDAQNVSSDTLKKLIKLNEIPLFNRVGIGYLISLVPEDKLNDYTYVKMEMSAEAIEPVKAEFGTVNYKALYTEINTIQSRLSNRSYDLRISKDDIEIQNTDAETIDESSK